MIKKNIILLSLVVFTALFLVGCSDGRIEIERPGVVDDIEDRAEESEYVDNRPFFVMAPPSVEYNSTEEGVYFSVGYDVTQINPLVSSENHTGVQVYTYVAVPEMVKEFDIFDEPSISVPWGSDSLRVCWDGLSIDRYCIDQGYAGGEHVGVNANADTCALRDERDVSWSEGNTPLVSVRCYNWVSGDEYVVSEEALFDVKSDSTSYHGLKISWIDFEQYCGEEVKVGSILNPKVDDIESVGGNSEAYLPSHVEEAQEISIQPAMLKEYVDTVEIVCI